MDNTFKSPAILSLCTGMRGLERGIERAIGTAGGGIRTLAYVEIEAFIIENLVRQMEQGILDPAPVWANLKTFPWSAFHGKVHFIIGGYPCQPFSTAGERKGTEDPRHLWPFIKSGITAIRPLCCFFENVPGHISLGYKEVRSDMESLGYTVEEGIFSAEEIGAPHQRKRLFIFAMENAYRKSMRNDIGGIHRKIASAGFKLEHTYNNGQNGSENRESVAEGNNGGAPGEENALKFTGSGSLANNYDKRQSQQERQLQESGDGLIDSSQVMANTCGSGSQRKQCGGIDIAEIRDGKKSNDGSITKCGDDRWPARPSEDQHEWEPPRIESSLGYVLNGYNFREDLLRMAGNGVVEQTAELAFRTLLMKHLS